MLSSTAKRRWRLRAFKDQDGLCFWCGQQMILRSFKRHGQPDHRLHVTLEHLVPVSKGGKDSRRNVVAACLGCNVARKDHDLAVWLVRVRLRLKQWGNPEHFETVLRHLASCGIVTKSGPPQRVTVETGLTTIEEKSRNGLATDTPHG